MITIENIIQLTNALDKLTEQRFLDHDQLDCSSMAQFITNGIKREISEINAINPDKEEQSDCKNRLNQLSSSNVDAAIKLLRDVITNVMDLLTDKTSAVYELMNRMLPFDFELTQIP